jgi:catechol 2,3-dioxygenase-like lactoylglutathione lyase family enzyme
VAVLGLNHVAFRTTDAVRLRDFYLALLDAEELGGEHGVLRAGSLVLAFFEADAPGIGRGETDELAFEVDAAGFEDVLRRAGELDALDRPPVPHTRWSRRFVVRDPDGRPLEFVHDDLGVYWREDE